MFPKASTTILQAPIYVAVSIHPHLLPFPNPYHAP